MHSLIIDVSLTSNEQPLLFSVSRGYMTSPDELSRYLAVNSALTNEILKG